MNKQIGIFVFSLAVSVLMLSPAYAHHGWGGYVERISGAFTITEVLLGNPHDRLLAADENGQEWNLLLAPPARNRRFGFGPESISVGDEVEILGQRHPSRLEIKVHCINLDGENLYTYRYGSGITSFARLQVDGTC